MNDFAVYEELGFEGFKTVGELMKSCRDVPQERGVYLVLRTTNEFPHFVEQGSGGFYQGKNPNVPIEELKKKWVVNEFVLNIGKAGKEGGKTTLRSRIRKYMRFGMGKSTSHWGGRYIWQLQDAKELIICWKKLYTEDPRTIEKEMISAFKKAHERQLPFANLEM